MANAVQLYVNRPVSYLDNTRPSGSPQLRWTAARIVSVVNPTSVVLERSGGGSINGGVAVAKSTRAPGETNVWRPY